MLCFSGNVLRIEGKDIELPYCILDATMIEGSILVIYDYMEFNKNNAASNLVRIDSEGNQIWVAENPTGQQTDAYTNFNREVKAQEINSLVANNFSGYYCSINLTDGKLLNAQFTK